MQRQLWLQCGPCSGSASPTPSGPSPEKVKQQKERARLKAKQLSSDEALDCFDRKDRGNAIRSFEEALDRDPDDSARRRHHFDHEQKHERTDAFRAHNRWHYLEYVENIGIIFNDPIDRACRNWITTLTGWYGRVEAVSPAIF